MAFHLDAISVVSISLDLPSIYISISVVGCCSGNSLRLLQHYMSISFKTISLVKTSPYSGRAVTFSSASHSDLDVSVQDEDSLMALEFLDAIHFNPLGDAHLDNICKGMSESDRRSFSLDCDLACRMDSMDSSYDM